ncbi:glycoside hydrolase [Herbiconiux moechotypicola]|uniref:exo-alpha-sialidase n=1 Tax=Herbiconiux moechotypicola TaxID=637393 RepID=A0ABN3E670_9MICO|nr:sialidase family protein [Herbiconiux moechotypicola]MCS5731901.1 glycoside hydrolase [Herbiconiux moechotypicola]
MTEHQPPTALAPAGLTRRGFIALGSGLGAAALTGLSFANGPRASAAPLFDDVGVVSNDVHHLPTIIHVEGSTLVIAAQRRRAVASGVHPDKGAADIVTFRSTDGGATWGPMRYVYQTSGTTGDCGYAPVVTMIDGELSILHTVGPQDWAVTDLEPHQRFSPDGGDTWGADSTPVITSAHDNGLPTNGGKGFQFPTGRVVAPGRNCLLYSDDGGASWTATPEILGNVETKTVPYFLSGAISRTALAPWRTSSTTSGRIGKARLADFYQQAATVNHTFGADFNIGFSRYDGTRLLQTGSRSNQLYARLSANEGVSWTNEKNITGSAPSARYSDVAVTDDGTIVVVFMQNGSPGAALRVVRFNLEWLTS